MDQLVKKHLLIDSISNLSPNQRQLVLNYIRSLTIRHQVVRSHANKKEAMEQIRIALGKSESGTFGF
ncbi:MAG TPA: hypothetical protein VD927_18920 [Chryseosolibacter sp.]|nr:hypothetical protein [Chryseosolibacter sp.]